MTKTIIAAALALGFAVPAFAAGADGPKHPKTTHARQATHTGPAKHAARHKAVAKKIHRLKRKIRKHGGR
jgi:uncharacterized protein YdeI (BOF family)